MEGGTIREKSRSLLGKKYRSLIDPRSFRARYDVFAYSTLLLKKDDKEVMSEKYDSFLDQFSSFNRLRLFRVSASRVGMGLSSMADSRLRD